LVRLVWELWLVRLVGGIRLQFPLGILGGLKLVRMVWGIGLVRLVGG